MTYPKWTFAAILASASLSSCAALHVPPAPATVADASKLDERLGIGAEVAYTTAAKLGTALARARLIDVVHFKALDKKAYSALLITREAYKAGNAKSYADGVAAVQSIVKDIQALVENNHAAG